MKKLLRKTALLFLALTLIMGYSSCSKECNLTLCDLIIDLTLSTSGDIYPRVPMVFLIKVTNVPNNTDGCKEGCLETMTSGDCHYRITIDHAPTASGNYTNMTNDLYKIPPIPPGEIIIEHFQLSLNEPGFHKIQVFADGLDEIEERDETNNASNTIDADELRINESLLFDPMIIQVFPKPDHSLQRRVENAQLL